MVKILKGIYFTCPFLAFGSLGWYIFGDVDIWIVLFFFVFGYMGMFAGGAARQLEDSKKNNFIFRANDPVSIVRAAFFEIESKDEIRGLSHVKEEVLSLLDDKERVANTILKDKLDPRGLIYLLISNVANEKLCTGQYHFYRGKLNTIGHELLKAFKVASKQLVIYGVQSQMEHENDMASLQKEISEIG